MTTFTDFRRLLLGALDSPDALTFAADAGGSAEPDMVPLLPAVWRIAHGGFRALRVETRMSQRRFASAYGISRRNVEDWDAGISQPTAYALPLLAYAVLADLVGRAEG